jgi:hypothetical protein
MRVKGGGRVSEVLVDLEGYWLNSVQRRRISAGGLTAREKKKLILVENAPAGCENALISY